LAVKLVLLHSPLVGPGTWRAITPLLQARGFEVAVPDFAADMARPQPYYARLVRTASASVARDTAILVAHSGAGSLVPAIAASGRVLGAIFVDALMPHPGQCWFETVPQSLKSRLESLAHDGRVPPWHRWWPEGAIRSLFVDEASYARFVSELQEIPLAYLEEPAPDLALDDKCAGAYLQLGPGNADEASVAERLGWLVKRLTLHHLALLTHPEEVAGGITDLVRSIQR
jgi:hypothetical protein